MLSYIIRIKNPFLRNVLLCPVFLVYYVGYVLKASLPVWAGGHPNGNRLLQLDFYLFPVGIFIAAWRGEFV